MIQPTLSRHVACESFYNRPTAATRDRLFRALSLSILSELLSQKDVPLSEMENVTIFKIDNPINGRLCEFAYRGNVLGIYEYMESADVRGDVWVKMLFTPSNRPRLVEYSYRPAVVARHLL